MVKLICFLRRKPGLAVEEFHRYWREEHGPLVASTRSGQHAVRYEQNHRLAQDYERDPDGFDGVAQQWFASLQDFYASLKEPDYQQIAADLEQFVDTDRLVFILSEEPEVIMGGPGW